MARLPGEVDGRRFLRAMARFGWKVESQRGSHRKLVHPERRDFLIIAFHRNLGRNTVRRILRQAGIDEEEFMNSLRADMSHADTRTGHRAQGWTNPPQGRTLFPRILDELGLWMGSAGFEPIPVWVVNQRRLSRPAVRHPAYPLGRPVGRDRQDPD